MQGYHARSKLTQMGMDLEMVATTVPLVPILIRETRMEMAGVMPVTTAYMHLTLVRRMMMVMLLAIYVMKILIMME